MLKKRYRVPVIMFHSVGTSNLNWPYSFLSEDIKLFERKIDYLIKAGYHFIFHNELYYYVKDNKNIPQKSLMITFDDGYLDNWVIVFPILKKRNIKFTIYISQEFVDPCEFCRPTLEDVWNGNISESELELLGHLSWTEMRKMEASGLVDIQSHTSTHTWHFTANRIIDYLNSKNLSVYPWILWNRYPQYKPRWMMKNNEMAKQIYGLPIYESQRAIGAKKYFEDEQLNKILVDYVSQYGGTSFLMQKKNREALDRIVSDYKNRMGELGKFETDEELESRIRYELLENRKTIEKALNKEVRFLCWPGGYYNEKLLGLAEQCGYYASTVKEGFNTWGNNPAKVNRISYGNPLGYKQFPWKYQIFTLRFYLHRFHGKYWAVAMDNIYRKFIKEK